MRAAGRSLPLLLVMVSIFLLSHQPGDTLELPNVFAIDKLAHFTVYGILALTAIHALAPLSPNRGLRFAALIICLCILYGISDEFHQSFIPYRTVSIFDLLADALGASAVTLGWLGLFSKKEDKRISPPRKGSPNP